MEDQVIDGDICDLGAEEVAAAFQELLVFSTTPEVSETGLLEDSEQAHMLADSADRCIDFRAAGVLTSNDGFVLTLVDGSEFQVTVVQTKVGR
jgi:hypothetical protein